MATINVTTTVDENNGTGEVSLREAIIQANSTLGEDDIILTAGQTYKLTIAGIDENKSAKGDLDIGEGSKITISVVGNGKATIDGNKIDRVFDVSDAISMSNLGDLTLKNIVITSGNVNGGEGGGIYSKGKLQLESSIVSGNVANTGGGIFSNRYLNIFNSTISENSASYTASSSAGGIYSRGTSNITNSSIINNTASGRGGAISSGGDLTVTNSTISSNQSHYSAIYNATARNLTITNSTITNNHATQPVASWCGGIHNRGNLNIGNSIVAKNISNTNSPSDISKDYSGTTLISQGNNLIGSTSYTLTTGLTTTDKVGVDPLLGNLQNNGGPTATHALLTGSPAINAGNSTLTRDQRGFGRNGIADIGAFEYEGINNIIPLSITSVIPANDTTEILPTTDLVINFNEPITKTFTGNVFIKKLTDNSIVETIAGGSDKMTVNGSQLIINPGTDLAGGTDYYVEITEGVVTDIIGNNFAGITGNTTWNFQTIAPPDTTPPIASSFTPVDNATDVPLASDLSINFSEPIQKGTGSIVIKQLADNSVLETINITSTNVTISENQLNINPTKNLSLNTDYYVEIDNGAIQDLAGNNYPGITEKTTWNFKSIIATSGADKIIGTDGNDTIDGGAGDDTIIGGPGNDTYIVNSVRERVVEALNAGTDTILSFVSYTLPVNVENLTLAAVEFIFDVTSINGKGNSLNNIIIGNNANNIINGSTGDDTMGGKGGHDTYTVDSIGDKVIEALNAGTDRIFSTVTYTLPANVENLTLQGIKDINGNGNELNNFITGNSAANTISGDGGNDILIGAGGNDIFLVNPGNDRLSGGTGADKFTYNTKAVFKTTAVGVDTITDFVISQNDKIVLDKTTFPKITSANGTGFSRDAEFAKVSSNTAAAISGADIVYNTVTGELFYNQNGTATGFGTGGKFAVLSNKPNLTENQFIIQA